MANDVNGLLENGCTKRPFSEPTKYEVKQSYMRHGISMDNIEEMVEECDDDD